MSDQRQTRIPIAWKRTLFHIIKCGIFLCMLFMLLKVGDHDPAWSVWIMTVTVVWNICDLLYTLIHHSLSERGLSIRFLGIPVRVIPWERIRHASYLHTWIETKDFVGQGQIIVVAFSGCPRFFYETDSLYGYLQRHLIGATCIWLPNHDVRQYTESFESHFPSLERQNQESAKRIRATRRLRKLMHMF